MTARPSIERLADDAPVVELDISRLAIGSVNYLSTVLEAIWLQNMARRDANAAKHGEPLDSYEFYRGRKA